MAQTTLLAKIDRQDTFPKFYPVTVSNNYFYVSVTTDSWTEQMFYELPCIRIDFYTEINGTKTRYKTVSSYMGTYNPIFPPTNAWEFCQKFEDVPESGYVAITPIFDSSALYSHNLLVEDGIETGDKWTTQTDSFNISIKVITE